MKLDGFVAIQFQRLHSSHVTGSNRQPHRSPNGVPEERMVVSVLLGQLELDGAGRKCRNEIDVLACRAAAAGASLVLAGHAGAPTDDRAPSDASSAVRLILRP